MAPARSMTKLRSSAELRTTDHKRSRLLPSQSRLLTIHGALYQLSVSLAGGFVGAFLLKVGFSLTETLLFYALLMTARLGMRFCALELVRRSAYKYAIILGVGLSALQFLPLMQARQWPWLAAWIVTLSLAESVYWPIYHSASAIVGHKAFGRELGIRAAAASLVNVIGPAAGGLVLAKYGADIEFSLAALVAVLSIIPLLWLTRIFAGPVPHVRRAMRPSDFRGMIVFAADGWMSSGITLAWPMILFLSLGSRYEALGLANAGAGMAGAVAGLYSGAIIDRGSRARSVSWVLMALAGGIALRGAADWSPLAAATANVTGAAVMGFYVPILLSVMYAGAKRSEGAYAFHFAAEAGWDLGAAGGCFAAAAIAGAGGHSSLAVIPSCLAVFVLNRTLRSNEPPVHDAA